MRREQRRSRAASDRRAVVSHRNVLELERLSRSASADRFGQSKKRGAVSAMELNAP